MNYAIWNDLTLCRQWIGNLNALELQIIKPEHLGRCCSCSNKSVQTIYFGRFANVDVCDSCLAIETEFIDLLKQLPEEPPERKEVRPIKSAGIVVSTKGTKSKAGKKLNKMLMTKEERESEKMKLIRIELEKHGQGSLFDL